MTIQAVLFDLDDTLYGDFKTCDRLGLEAAGRYAAQMTGVDAQKAADAMQKGRLTLRESLHYEPESHDRTLFAKIGLESLGINPIPYAEGMHEAYWKATLDAMERRPGVHELLTQLKDSGIRVGICTNMMADIQMRKLCRLGIADVCGTLISSEEAGRDKPHAPIFELALKRMGVPAENILMVGDNIRHDVQGALAMHMQALWLNTQSASVPELGQPFFTADSFPEAAEQIYHLCGIKKE